MKLSLVLIPIFLIVVSCHPIDKNSKSKRIELSTTLKPCEETKETGSSSEPPTFGNVVKANCKEGYRYDHNQICRKIF